MTHPIYFDNAATTFPKPPSVINAVARTMLESGGNPGRGSHRLARAASRILYDCREALADFVGLSDPTRISFTKNTTEALNLALKGLLKNGDHILISDLEHNSVYRLIAALAKQGILTYDVFSTEALAREGSLERELLMKLKPQTRAIVTTHASNVCSRSIPLHALGRFARRYGLLLIVDAAQSIGHLPIHMEEMQITALCAPGHKGLYGPQGSGFLALSPALSEEQLPCPLLEGGSGYESLRAEMPSLPPERYEAGTVSTPTVAGLLHGVRFVREVGLDEMREKEYRLFRLARDRLLSTRGVHVYAPECEGSVLSFSVRGRAPEEIADLLDDNGICVRAGFHCAALAHKTLGTEAIGGTVRLGFGYFNTENEVCTLLSALRRIL